jgi:triphosphoribosyl-dephospho-CoA synthase
MTVEDFRVSYKVSAEPITNPDYSLGEKIFYAVKATRDAVGCNTNLGIILLCAPLIEAAYKSDQTLSFRVAVADILDHTTIYDADWTFKAIALAAPAGLGDVEQQDVHEKPDITLTEAMKLAGSKDRIAMQYATNYKDIFDFSVLRYNTVLNRWGYQNWAAVAVYAQFLLRFPDSHIERKFGNKHTRMVTASMAMVDQELSKAERPEQLEDMLYRIDAEFKSAGVNPGTTADITVATVLVAYLDQLGS